MVQTELSQLSGIQIGEGRIRVPARIRGYGRFTIGFGILEFRFRVDSYPWISGYLKTGTRESPDTRESGGFLGFEP